MEFVTQIDGEILLWIQEYLRKDFLDPVMTAVTGLGDAGWFWIAASVFLLFSKQYKSVGLTGLIALFFGFLITNLWLKNAVMRIRPYEVIEGLRLIGKKAVDFSFPSGHSTASMAASVVFLIRLPKKAGIYIGIHYPSDVLAGMAIGTAAAAAALWIMNKRGGALE